MPRTKSSQANNTRNNAKQPKVIASARSLSAFVKFICDIMRRSICSSALQYVPELTWNLSLRLLDARTGLPNPAASRKQQIIGRIMTEAGARRATGTTTLRSASSASLGIEWLLAILFPGSPGAKPLVAIIFCGVAEGFGLFRGWPPPD